MNSLTIVQAADRDFPVQTFLQGGIATPVYSSSDSLSGAVFQGRTLTPIFIPTVGWYTKNGLQTGYDQGQILIGINNAQSAMLIVGGKYMVITYWSPADNPTKTGIIARMILIVEAKQNF